MFLTRFFNLSLQPSRLDREPASDCIIDNASSRELLALAADSITGPTANTVELVTNIVSRPDTLNCLLANGLPALL